MSWEKVVGKIKLFRRNSSDAMTPALGGFYRDLRRTVDEMNLKLG